MFPLNLCSPKNLIKTVYGLGYRLNVSEPEAQPTTTTVAVEQAWKKYQGVMEERIDILERAAIAIEQGTLGNELCQTSQVTAHNLVGALGSFGFPMGSNLAQRLEKLLQTIPATDIPAAQFNRLVQQLRYEISDTTVDTAATPLLLLISADAHLADQLSLEATHHPLRVRQASSVVYAQQLLRQHNPQLVIFDIALPLAEDSRPDNPPDNPLAQTVLDTIARFTQQFRGPFLVLSSPLPVQARLQLVQQGANRLLDRASSPHQLMSEILQVMRTAATPAKIVIVDDDLQVLERLQSELSAWNFDITVLTDSRELWQTLERVQPDAIVLDVTMPEMDGFDICQVLRAEPKWRNLPILFLTAYQEDTMRESAFQFGGNDFINKSVTTSELAVRILNQIHHA